MAELRARANQVGVWGPTDVHRYAPFAIRNSLTWRNFHDPGRSLIA
jgi:hypothetical protein